MYAQIGNIVFKGLRGFDSFQQKRETNFAQHAVIEGKPRLQRVGTNLDEINISIQFHASFCDPETEIRALDRLRQSAEIVAVLAGSGEFIGNFVIQSISRDVSDLGPRGNIMNAIVSLTLLEAVIADPVGAASLAAKLSGFGNALNNPLKVNVIPRLQSEASAIAAPVTKANALAGTVSDLMTKAKRVSGQASHYAKRAQEGLREMQSAVSEANQKLTDAQQVYASAVRMKGSFAETQGAISSTILALQSGDLDGALTANQSLQLAVSRTNSACSEVTNITATRR